MTNLSDWQGSVGNVWADHAHALDRVLGPFGRAAMDQMGDLAGQRVLDLGCGSGASCTDLVARGAQVTGVDVSQALIDVARTRDPSFSYALVLGDAAQVEFARPFENIFSRFGVMFFDAPVDAFAHLRRSIVPGGKFCGVAWCGFEENDWAKIPYELVAPLVKPAAQDSSGPGPFAWADQAVFEPIFEKAGWQDVTAKKVTFDVPLALGDAQAGLGAGVEFAMKIGPAAASLKGADDPTKSAVRDALSAGLKPHLCDDVLRLGGTAWVIEAVA